MVLKVNTVTLPEKPLKGFENIDVFKLFLSDDGIIPIEVKSSENTKSKRLKVYNKLYKPKYMIRISSKDFGYNPSTKIKSVPLYATFLIKELV